MSDKKVWAKEWERSGGILLANLDVNRVPLPQGDRSQCLDHMNDTVEGPADEAELTRLSLNGQGLTLRLSPSDAKRVRVFRRENGTWKRVAGLSASGPPTDTWAVPPGPADLTIEATTLPAADFPGSIAIGFRPDEDPMVFRVAPLLFTSNLHRVEKIFIRSVKGDTDRAIGEIKAALAGLPVEFAPAEMDGGPGDDRDLWLRDEFAIGYCWAPHEWMHVVLQLPREPAPGERDVLEEWVKRELPAPRMGLFPGLDEQGDSPNFGGNLEVSPPVPKTTGALDCGPAGAAVPEQPPAPFGKILLGGGRSLVFSMAADALIGLAAWRPVTRTVREAFARHMFTLGPDDKVRVQSLPRGGWRITEPWRQFEIVAAGGVARVYAVRSIFDDVRGFLEAQGVQPILPIDTSWLEVGHIDEVVTTVAAPATARGFAMPVVSPGLAVDLLTAAQNVQDSGPGGEHARVTGLFHGLTWGQDQPATMSVDEALRVHRETNEDLQIGKLIPIEQRLIDGLALDPEAIVRLPVLFAWLPLRQTAAFGVAFDGIHNRTFALTPNVVNMLAVGDHLLIPRPHGPRMSPADAETALKTAGVTGAATGEPRLPVGEDGRVDLFEACTSTVLAPLGVTVHYIETWDAYHQYLGELHCATNVVRRPPELDHDGPYWWEVR
ncbi:hypothetical protein J4573_23660 [Actinomadura barringtoniae]|uniref:Protein-arginine deiminase C-terminal domain-containing protein n=1 Tax=Actinomadura barringtoniae TaxID=1427535 RepID=A0A939PCK2_9ACTN|nr:protein-arginine deiminase family protein [Actinomadura barringtoniae]MBO2450120.1 hypothetical protein [Actinomadura barringtoniae]